MPWTRRDLIRGAAAVLALSGCRALPLRSRPTESADDPPARVFPQSVASGDPTPSGAVVWTRIAPETHVAGQDLVLEVARDPEIRDLVLSRRVASSRIGPERDFTVRVDLDGKLTAGSSFFYRFVYGESASRIGRLRTLPAEGAAPDRLRFALVSCQDYTRGHFDAYDHAARQDLDFILHVGDFLYESVVPARSLPGRGFALPSGGTIARTLDDFRTIHRTYRTDSSLQRALERHTLIAIWDDHEVGNDRYFDRAAGRLRAPDHPLDTDPAASDELHAGGIRAWSEYLPVRPRYDSTKPRPSDRIRVERSFRFGNLAELFLTDTRLRRDAHPCGEGAIGERLFRMEATCPQRRAPGRSMLGEEQRRWLVDGLAGSRSRWKLWGTSVPLSSVGYGSGPGRIFLTLDTWAGFEHERRGILSELESRGIENLVSLTGDMHTFFAATLHAGEVDPLREPSRALGVEFGTGALSAAPLGEIAAMLSNPTIVTAHNPQMGFWSPFANGYSHVEITPDEIRYEPRRFAVDRTVESAEGEVLGRLRVRSGVAAVEAVSS